MMPYDAVAFRCHQHGSTSAMVANLGWKGAAKPVVALFRPFFESCARWKNMPTCSVNFGRLHVTFALRMKKMDHLDRLEQAVATSSRLFNTCEFSRISLSEICLTNEGFISGCLELRIEA